MLKNLVCIKLNWDLVKDFKWINEVIRKKLLSYKQENILEWWRIEFGKFIIVVLILGKMFE